MNTRRETTRRYDDEERRGPPRKGDRPVRDDPPPRESKKAKGAGLNEYFIDGEGVQREVLQKEICRFLGPEAYSRPYSMKGVEGFMIQAIRPFTPEMLDDLHQLSRDYISEREDKNRRGVRVNYPESATNRRHEALRGQDVDMDSGDDYDDERVPPPRGGRYDDHMRDARGLPEPSRSRVVDDYPPANPYLPRSGQQPSYASTLGFQTQIPEDYGRGTSSIYSPTGARNSGAREANEGRGSYAPPYGGRGGGRGDRDDPYGQPPYQTGSNALPPGSIFTPGSGYSVPGHTATVRPGSTEAPYVYGPSPSYGNPGPQNPRYAPVSGDVAMGNVYDDDHRTPAQPSRGYAPPPRAAAPAPYERDSPGLRDPYRQDPPREERRRRQ